MRLLKIGLFSEGPNEPGNCPSGLLVKVCVILGLSAAFLDLSCSMVLGLSKPSAIVSLLSPLAIAMIVFGVLYLISWLVVVRAIGRALKLDMTALAVALAVFIAIVHVLFTVLGKIGLGSFITDLRKPFVAFVFVLLSLYISASMFAIVQDVGQRARGRRIGAAVFLALPLILAETTAAIWLNKYHIERFLTSTSILIHLGYIIAVAFTLLLLVRIVSLSVGTKLVYMFAILTLLSSALAVSVRLDFVNLSKSSVREVKGVRHIILLSMDALRPNDLSCYNREGLQTPNIDRLGNDGIVFESAFSAAPWTLPSITSIMTGLSPAVHLAIRPNSRLPDNVKTLAEYMSEVGYVTSVIGQSFFLHRHHNISLGFDEYNVFPKSKDESLGGKLLKWLFPKGFATEASTTDLTQLAIDWLGTNVNHDFFLCVFLLDPHMPYSPPAEFLPPSLEPQPRIGREFNKTTAVKSGHLVPTAEERKWIKSLYESEIRYVDANVGRLLDHLKQLGIYDESLIILTSDHGEEFWEHNGFEHGHSVYNEVIRVPLIIKLPGNLQKQMISRSVSTESIMPTILELCGIQYNRDYLSSRGLTELWEKPLEVETYEPIVSTGLLYYEDRIAVIFDGLKYIRWLLTGQEELYDLGSDPDEKRCLAEQFPEKIQRARSVLAEYLEKAGKLKQHYKVSKGKEAVLDEETLQQLKSLGYVE